MKKVIFILLVSISLAGNILTVFELIEEKEIETWDEYEQHIVITI